jgi:hypothetical protein
MVNPAITSKCRSLIQAVASRGETIPYSRLAKNLGVANQSVGHYLDEIYKEECDARRPDLTVVVVYAGTKMGRYNSRGKPAKSKKVDPRNPTDVKAYQAELKAVHGHWRGK